MFRAYSFHALCACYWDQRSSDARFSWWFSRFPVGLRGNGKDGDTPIPLSSLVVCLEDEATVTVLVDGNHD